MIKFFGFECKNRNWIFNEKKLLDTKDFDSFEPNCAAITELVVTLFVWRFFFRFTRFEMAFRIFEIQRQTR